MSDPISPETLSAFFDGELEASEASKVEAALEADPQLRAELTGLQSLRAITVDTFEHAAAEVPQARFEQIWDEIDRTIDREQRLRTAAERHVSLMDRVWAAISPFKWGLVAAGAAAALIVAVLPPGDDTVNQPGERMVEATDPPAHPAPSSPRTNPVTPTPDKLADATPPAEVSLPAPDNNDADIEMIEFGGKAGRIGQIEGKRGTTTVIWVTEEEPVDSERSL